MSEWHEVSKENLNIDKERKTLEIYVKSNDNGSVYAEVKIDDIFEILKKHEPGETNLLIQLYVSAIKELVDALRKYGMREHLTYSDLCESGCCCGADEHNAEVQAIVDKFEVKE